MLVYPHLVPMDEFINIESHYGDGDDPREDGEDGGHHLDPNPGLHAPAAMAGTRLVALVGKHSGGE